MFVLILHSTTTTMVPSGYALLHAQVVRQLRAAPAGSRAFVMDVGANNGEWSRSWAKDTAAAAREDRRIELHLFEPNPLFREPLTRMAKQHNVSREQLHSQCYPEQLLSVPAARPAHVSAFALPRSLPSWQPPRGSRTPSSPLPARPVAVTAR